MTYKRTGHVASRGEGAMILKRVGKGKASYVERCSELGKQESRSGIRQFFSRERSDGRLRGLIPKLAQAEAKVAR